MKLTQPLIAAALLLSACGSQQEADNRATNPVTTGDAAVFPPEAEMGETKANLPPLPTDAWRGRWIGVEGLVLDIQPGGKRGRYNLTITLLDGTNNYVGTADGEAIRFSRDGIDEMIRRTDGAATGLKYLAEKRDCLTIKEGEGFCRD